MLAAQRQKQAGLPRPCSSALQNSWISLSRNFPGMEIHEYPGKHEILGEFQSCAAPSARHGRVGDRRQPWKHVCLRTPCITSRCPCKRTDFPGSSLISIHEVSWVCFLQRKGFSRSLLRTNVKTKNLNNNAEVETCTRMSA